MPRIAAKVIKSKIENGKMLAIVQFNGRLPQKGQQLSVKWGSIRSLPQNRLYFKYLHFLIEDCGLKEHGQYSVQGLHENLKSYVLSEKLFDKGAWKSIETATTTDLTRSEFSNYFDIVDKVVQETFGVDTSSFWETYADNYQIQ